MYDFDSEILCMLRKNRARRDSPNCSTAEETLVKQEIVELPQPEFEIKSEEPLEIVDILEFLAENVQNLDNDDNRSDTTEPFCVETRSRRGSSDSDVVAVDWPVYGFESEDWYTRAVPAPIGFKDDNDESQVEIPEKSKDLVENQSSKSEKSVTNPPFFCEKCKKLYKLPHTFKRHMTTKHPDQIVADKSPSKASESQETTNEPFTPSLLISNDAAQTPETSPILLEEVLQRKRIRARAKTICVETFRSRRLDVVEIKIEPTDPDLPEVEIVETVENPNPKHVSINTSLRRSGRLSCDGRISYRHFFTSATDSESNVVSKPPNKTRQKSKDRSKIQKINLKNVETPQPEPEPDLVTPFIVRMPKSAKANPFVFKKSRKSRKFSQLEKSAHAECEASKKSIEDQNIIEKIVLENPLNKNKENIEVLGSEIQCRPFTIRLVDYRKALAKKQQENLSKPDLSENLKQQKTDLKITDEKTFKAQKIYKRRMTHAVKINHRTEKSQNFQATKIPNTHWKKLHCRRHSHAEKGASKKLHHRRYSYVEKVHDSLIDETLHSQVEKLRISPVESEEKAVEAPKEIPQTPRKDSSNESAFFEEISATPKNHEKSLKTHYSDRNRQSKNLSRSVHVRNLIKKSQTDRKTQSLSQKMKLDPGKNPNFENKVKSIISECTKKNETVMKSPEYSSLESSDQSPFENIMKNIQQENVRQRKLENPLRYRQFEDGRSKSHMRQRSRSEVRNLYDAFDEVDPEPAPFTSRLTTQLQNDIRSCWKNFQMKFVKDLNKTLTKSMKSLVGGHRENRENSTINICVKYGTDDPRARQKSTSSTIKYKAKDMIQKPNSQSTKKLCPWCDNWFLEKEELLDHLKRQHLQMESSNRSIFTCPDCDQIYHDKEEYRSHCARVHKVAYKCTYPDCKENFSNYEMMCQHLQDHIAVRRRPGIRLSFGDEIAILDRKIYGDCEKKVARTAKRSKTIDGWEEKQMSPQSYRLKSSKPQMLGVRRPSLPGASQPHSRSLAESPGTGSGSDFQPFNIENSSTISSFNLSEKSTKSTLNVVQTSNQKIDPKLSAVTNKIKESLNKRRRSILIDLPDDCESWDEFNRRKKPKVDHREPRTEELTKEKVVSQTSTPKTLVNKSKDSRESTITNPIPEKIQKIKETLEGVLMEQNISRIRETLMEAVNELNGELISQDEEIIEINEAMLKKPKVNENQANSTKGNFICYKCDPPKGYAYEKWLFKHDRENHEKEVPEGSTLCEDCNEVIPDELKRHYCRKKCSKCSKKLAFYGNFKDHKCLERKKTVDPNKMIACNLCSQKFVYMKNLRNHVKKCHPDSQEI